MTPEWLEALRAWVEAIDEWRSESWIPRTSGGKRRYDPAAHEAVLSKMRCAELNVLSMARAALAEHARRQPEGGSPHPSDSALTPE